MREYIYTNLKIIKKHFKKRSFKISKLNNLSINKEFMEWNNDSYPLNEVIWTLPDLTNNDRYKNFCRSIKKKIK